MRLHEKAVDTYGDDALRDLFCPADIPSDWIEQGGDCDDTDPEIKPWAEEICDGVDNDCNGFADCRDFACRGFCPVENSSRLCTDGLDNDNDTFLDCDDDSCRDLQNPL